MRKLFIIGTVLAMAAGAHAASINWGSTSVTWILDDAGSPIAAGAGYVALVYVGDDGVANTTEWYDYASDDFDDVIVDSGLVGEGTKGGTTAGQFIHSGTAAYNYTYDSPYSNGDNFYIVFYDAADPLNASFYGVVGLTNGGTSGSATLFSITASDNSGTDMFAPTGSYQADIAVVPEPGTILLGLAGIGALVARRKARK